MTSSSKTPAPRSAASHADLHGINLYRVAIVGATSLKGKEVAEVLRDRNFPAIDVRLLDDDESFGQLEAVGDEMNIVQSIRSEQFERVDFAFFSADPRSTRNNWKVARDLGDTIVDLSFALEDQPFRRSRVAAWPSGCRPSRRHRSRLARFTHRKRD